MDFTIKNVGVVKESTIKLDGLTVITGANNSGKSTIGKALYATIEGLNNIEQKRERELRFYFQRIQDFIVRTLHLDAISSYIDYEKISDDDQKFFNMLLISAYRFDAEPVDIDGINAFKEYIEKIDEQYIKSILRPTQTKATQKVRSYLANFNDFKQQALKYFDRIDEWLLSDNLEKYAVLNLMAQINVEFQDQVAPIKIKKKDLVSSISLSKNGEIGSAFSIKNGEIISVGRAFNSTFFNDVLLIDNPFVVDRLSNGGIIFAHRGPRTISSHSEKLISIFNERETESVIEQKVNETQYAYLMEHINEVLPGKITRKEGRFFYSEGDSDLNVINLATGSKTFAIIKTLLQKGKIGMNTMLILDEPESHLHPDWQNKFAEIIVLLVKYFDVNILLTTHSVNFALAIETYSKKYNLESNTNFYRTKYIETQKYLIEYENVNNRLDELYKDFVKPFSEIRALNMQYTFNDEE